MRRLPIALGRKLAGRALFSAYAHIGWDMPRYFFHLEGRGERIADRRGQILPDEAAALREANLVAAALRTYRGQVWRVIEWGHEVSEAPAPLEASA